MDDDDEDVNNHSFFDQYCISHKNVSYRATAAPSPEVKSAVSYFPALPLIAINAGDAAGDTPRMHNCTRSVARRLLQRSRSGPRYDNDGQVATSQRVLNAAARVGWSLVSGTNKFDRGLSRPAHAPIYTGSNDQSYGLDENVSVRFVLAHTAHY